MSETARPGWGLTAAELQSEIEIAMARLDELQEDAEHFGQYSEMMRMAAMTAFHRAAELIEANNRRLSQQLAAAGIVLPPGV